MLTLAVKRMISNLEVNQTLIESLSFENVNSECKRMIKPLKATSSPTDEQIRNMDDIESHNYDAAVVEEISRN